MKKYSSYIFIAVAVLVLGGIALVPHTAMAIVPGVSNLIQDAVTGGSKWFFSNMLASTANAAMSIAGWFLTVCGVFLSISMNITIHIKDIFEGAGNQTGVKTAVETVWVVIRDLSSIFIIFALLYTSIMTIVGRNKTGINQLIANIFLAGILINFSLFFVKVAVDASNLVSLQFYNAIAPQTQQNFSIASAFNDGGLSNIFMQSLKIPAIYGNGNGALKSTDVYLSIGIAGIGGTIMMVAAALSFLGAAIAFTARTAIILFVMGLSPLFFAGMIFPKIREKVSDPLWGILKGQLIFMPVYLALLYVALKFISDQGFMKIFNQAASGGAAANTSVFGPTMIGIMIQYAIAMIFINAPLIAAISLGAHGMKWVPGSSGINAINKWVSGKATGVIGRNTLGNIGKGLGSGFDNLAASNFAQNTKTGKFASSILRATNISQTVRGGLKNTENSKYGGAKSLADIEKEGKTRAQIIDKKIKEKRVYAEIDTALAAGALRPTLSKSISKMGTKELEDLDDKLFNPKIAAALSSKQAENILKSSEISEADKDKFKENRAQGLTDEITAIGSSDMENILKEEFSDEQKEALKKARTNALGTVLGKGDPTKVEEYVRNLSGKELTKIPTSVLTDTVVMDSLSISQLQDMKDLKDAGAKATIKSYIGGLPLGSHLATGWINHDNSWR